MFGYVRIDQPNMLMKDFTLYKSFYCGLCHALRQNYTHVSRLFTNYDLTFLSVFAHTLLDTEITVKPMVCILNPVKRRPVVQRTEVMDRICDVAVLLAEYKLLDDISDGNKKKKFILRLVHSECKKAHTRFPAGHAVIQAGLHSLRELELDKCNQADRVADTFGNMLRLLTREILGDMYLTRHGDLMYAIGRWVYLADAIDDIDDDIRDGTYNVFLVDTEGISSKAQYIEENKADVEYILDSAYNNIKYLYDGMEAGRFEGIITNVLWYGILHQNDVILGRAQCEVACTKKRHKELKL